MNNILLIGAKGNLGQRIVSILGDEYTIKESDIDDNTVSTLDYLKNNKTDNVIIASPPSTHHDYLIALSDSVIDSKILCEKPLPIYDDYNQTKRFTNIQIIDHYLYKKEIVSAKKHFESNRNSIRNIELYLCESNIESRGWMFKKEKFGGVTYDLAHHLIAILGLLIGYDQLVEMRNLDIKKFKLFGDNLSDRELICEFNVEGFKVKVHVGKEIETNKSIVFIDNQSDACSFSLEDSVDYKKILEDPTKVLSMEQAIEVNTILERILAMNKSESIFRGLEGIDPDEALELLSNLNEEFRHRHSFYWSAYYRLLIYHLSLSAFPAIIYVNLITNKLLKGGEAIFAGLVLSIGALVLMRFLIKKTEKYLDDEDHRLKIPIDRMREIYYAKFNVNMYPGKNQNKSHREILFSQSVKNRAAGKGLGSNYMMQIFKIICYIASLSSVTYFAIVFGFLFYST